MDLFLTETYFIVARLHFAMVGWMLVHFAMVGWMLVAFLVGVHFWWPRVTGRVFWKSLVKLAVVTFIGFNLTLLPLFILGYLGMPRRYHAYPPGFHVVSPILIVLDVGYLLPIVYLGWLLKYGAQTGRIKIKQEHKVMLQAERAAGALLPEYHRATPECAHPEHWHMYDSMTAEAEVLEFLRTLVTTIKPKLVVETGSFLGVSTVWIAEGLKANGFGKIVSCEYDPVVFASAKEKIAASGLDEWIELRNESSLEMKVEGTIDLFFSDSDMPIRAAEVKRFLPQISPYGVILMHDASSHLKVVRDAAHAMEAEGLLSCVFLPTPRGLVIAQKREGRS